MRILHIGLSCCYTEGMLYQDNLLTHYNCAEGHEVTYITNTEMFVNGDLVKVNEEDKVLSNGLRLIRIEYDRIINGLVTKKIQKCKKVKKYLEEIQPEAILYHCCWGYELIDVAEYVKKNPGTLFYADTHQDFNNSSRSLVAKAINKCVHGYFVKKALSQVNKFLSISLESTEYLEKMYNIPPEMIEDFPLGGVLLSNEDRKRNRKCLLEKYGFNEDTIILGHSGKLTKGKKTVDLIHALSSIQDERFKLIIYGFIPDEDKELKKIIESEPKALFLGWKTGDEQHDLLGAIDLYCQPGTQSATAEIAACDGCALMLARHPSYKHLYGESALYADNIEEMTELFNRISSDSSILKEFKQKSRRIAEEKLDYKVLARRYLTK